MHSHPSVVKLVNSREIADPKEGEILALAVLSLTCKKIFGSQSRDTNPAT
jgi:hypothetical protein